MYEPKTDAEKEQQYKEGYNYGFECGKKHKFASTVNLNEWYNKGYYEGFEDAQSEILLEG